MLSCRHGGAIHRRLAPGLALAVLLALAAGGTHAHGISGLSREAVATSHSPVADAQLQTCWSCALAHTFTSPAIACIGVAPATADRLRLDETPRLVTDSLPRAITARGPPSAL